MASNTKIRNGNDEISKFIKSVLDTKDAEIEKLQKELTNIKKLLLCYQKDFSKLDAERCSAITQKGTRCKRPSNHNGRCWQHKG